jgi:hypothetical protein
LEDARADTDIDQDARLFAFDINRVALTAAGEYGKFENGSDLSEIATWQV